MGSGADASLAQPMVGRGHASAHQGVGRSHTPAQLRVGRRERHNLILGCEFHVLAFKWGWFIEIMIHQIYLVIFFSFLYYT